MKSSKRECKELTIVDSDRIELVRSANHFIGHMVCKELTMTEEESTTYSSALKYLNDQFCNGHSNTALVQTRTESETSQEIDPCQEPSN